MDSLKLKKEQRKQVLNLARDFPKLWKNPKTLPYGTTTTYLSAYDAGTEINDEDCGNIPGPLSCGGGEGYNEASGEGFVHPHPGTHGENEISVMMFSWADPVAMVTTRIVK